MTASAPTIKDMEALRLSLELLLGGADSNLLSTLANDLNAHYTAMVLLGGRHKFDAETTSSLFERWCLTLRMTPPADVAGSKDAMKPRGLAELQRNLDEGAALRPGQKAHPAISDVVSEK